MSVGENIKRIRKEKGLTQKQLGELCGLADSAIRRYENGGANPKIETKKKIANALEVPVEDIDPDLESLTKSLIMKEKERKMEEIEHIIKFLNSRTTLTDAEEEQLTEQQKFKIIELKKKGLENLQNIHLSIATELHNEEETQLQELRNTFISLNQDGKYLVLKYSDMLFRDERYRGKMIHPSKIKDIPQD